MLLLKYILAECLTAKRYARYEFTSEKTNNKTTNLIISKTGTLQGSDADLYVDETEALNGELWMPGNRVLISLNLSSTHLILCLTIIFVDFI